MNKHGNSNAWDKYELGDPKPYKITLAQQFTQGNGFWNRPAIRFYVLYQGGDNLKKNWDVPS